MWGGDYFEDPHDNVTERLNRFEKWVRSLCGLRSLDIGCGRGNISFALSVRGSKIVGLDIKRANLYEAKILQRKHRIRIPSEVHFLLADALHLPLREMTFDIAILSDFLEHIRDDKQVLAETYKILKTRGNVLITVPNQWQLIEHHTKFPLLGFFPAIVRNKKIGTNRWVKRLYSKADLQKLCSTYFHESYLAYLWPHFDRMRKKKKRLGDLLRKISNFLSKTPFTVLGTTLMYVGNKRVTLSTTSSIGLLFERNRIIAEGAGAASVAGGAYG